MPWYRITWDHNDREHGGTTFTDHAPLVEELLERIRSDGPLSSTDIEPRAAINWYWRPTNQVRAILEALAEAGVLGLARREGNRRVYDLAERLFPPELLAQRPPEIDQRRHKLLSRYRAHGLLGTGGQSEIWFGTGRTAADRRVLRADLVDAGALVPVEVEGVRGTRYVMGEEIAVLEEAARSVAAGEPAGPGVTFLAPLDPFAWDRDLLRSLFDFDYVWEVYVPAAKRRWGYYVLPMLAGDRLIGRIEPRIERKTGTLRIIDLWCRTASIRRRPPVSSRALSMRSWRTLDSRAFNRSRGRASHDTGPLARPSVRGSGLADGSEVEGRRRPAAPVPCPVSSAHAKVPGAAFPPVAHGRGGGRRAV